MKLYKGKYRVSSPYGNRRLDNGDDRFHSGIDYVGIDSKEIIAPTNGRVVSSQMITAKSNPTWEWGNYVKMDDLNGYYLFFCHLANRSVKVGQTVAKGQVIGTEGQTGYSFGSHLHFEVRRKKDSAIINPEQYFKILLDWYKNEVKKKYCFDDNTMNYLSKHPYPDALFEKLLK